MALGDTFDLGKAYAQAEAIKTTRADRQYRQDYMNLLGEQEQRHWAKMQQDNQFQSLYTEIQQVKAMPEEQQREWLASKPIGKDPRYANVPPGKLIEAMEAGVLVGLGKSPPSDGGLYLTDQGYLPKDEAKGRPAPKPQKADEGPVNWTAREEEEMRGGKRMKRTIWTNPRNPDQKKEGPWREVAAPIDPWAGLNLDGGSEPTGDAAPPPMARNPQTGEVVYYIDGQWVKGP